MSELNAPTYNLLRGRDVPLEEFPSLLAMEGHTGGSGVLFSAIWFGFAWYYFPHIRVPNVAWIACILFFVFFTLMWLSFYLTDSLSQKISEARTHPAERNKLQVVVRKWIVFLSASYAVTCCVLIWMTGGVVSPFIPFYTMIFTLTIPRIRVPRPGLLVLAFFLVSIFTACVAALGAPSPIADDDMKLIKDSHFQTYMYLAFICASIIVPTVSAYFVQRREERMPTTAMVQS